MSDVISSNLRHSITPPRLLKPSEHHLIEIIFGNHGPFCTCDLGGCKGGIVTRNRRRDSHDVCCEANLFSKQPNSDPGRIIDYSRGLSESPSRHSEGRSDTPGKYFKRITTPEGVAEGSYLRPPAGVVGFWKSITGGIAPSPHLSCEATPLNPRLLSVIPTGYHK